MRFLSSRLGALALLATSVAACGGSQLDSEPVGAESSAIMITGLFATGVNAAAMPLATGSVDPHYVLTSNDPLLPGPHALAVDAAAGWIANQAASKWISGELDANGANSTYTYTTTFTLAGVDPATASINGQWSCDDTCVMSLNGKPVAQNLGPNAWAAIVNFAVPVGSPFQLGANQLSIAVTNSGGGATGLQITQLTSNVDQCTIDSQCSAGQFCDTGTNTCVPKLGNGAPIPVIAGHAPLLIGMCALGVGPAVCVSGVCDMTDDKCGYANGDGPCLPANGPSVCRSGFCSMNDICEPAGKCFVDTDCAGTMYCDTGTNMCTPKQPNGAPIPKVPSHMPVLDGNCSLAEAAVACVSGVCDMADMDCGYANGDGQCDGATGPTVCRSSICGPASKCVQCLVNTSCPLSAPVCDPVTNACVGCAKDSDCGGSMSGLVCDDGKKVCENGCRGTGGNGCPNGDVCSSVDASIGTCGASSTSSSTGTGGQGTGGTGAGGQGTGGTGGQGTGGQGGQGGAGGHGGAASSTSSVGTGTATSTGQGGGGVGGSVLKSNSDSDYGVVALGSGACRMDGAPGNDTRPLFVALTLAALGLSRRRKKTLVQSSIRTR